MAKCAWCRRDIPGHPDSHGMCEHCARLHRDVDRCVSALATADHHARVFFLRQLPGMLARRLMDTQTTDASREAMDLLDRACQEQYGRLDTGAEIDDTESGKGAR